MIFYIYCDIIIFILLNKLLKSIKLEEKKMNGCTTPHSSSHRASSPAASTRSPRSATPPRRMQPDNRSGFSTPTRSTRSTRSTEPIEPPEAPKIEPEQKIINEYMGRLNGLLSILNPTAGIETILEEFGPIYEQYKHILPAHIFKKENNFSLPEDLRTEVSRFVTGPTSLINKLDQSGIFSRMINLDEARRAEFFNTIIRLCDMLIAETELIENDGHPQINRLTKQTLINNLRMNNTSLKSRKEKLKILKFFMQCALAHQRALAHHRPEENQEANQNQEAHETFYDLIAQARDCISVPLADTTFFRHDTPPPL